MLLAVSTRRATGHGRDVLKFQMATRTRPIPLKIATKTPAMALTNEFRPDTIAEMMFPMLSEAERSVGYSVAMANP
jgi:hypothetical protein